MGSVKKFSAFSSPLAGLGGNGQRLAMALIIRYSQAINPGLTERALHWEPGSDTGR